MFAQPASEDLAASESEWPGHGDEMSDHASPASGSASASLKLRRAAGGSLLAPASREIGAWERPPLRSSARNKRPPNIDTFDEASGVPSTPSHRDRPDIGRDLPRSNRMSVRPVEIGQDRPRSAPHPFRAEIGPRSAEIGRDRPRSAQDRLSSWPSGELLGKSPDAYDLSDQTRRWIIGSPSPIATPPTGPKVVFPSNVDLAQRLGFPVFGGAASKVAPAPEAHGKAAPVVAYASDAPGLQVPPVPPSLGRRADERTPTADVDSYRPENRLRATAGPSGLSRADASQAGDSMQGMDPPLRATPGAQGSLVELPEHGEEALASVAERERRRHPLRHALTGSMLRASDDLWDFLVEWFSIEQFASPMQYLEMDKVKDMVQADVEGQHQEAMIMHHRPSFTVVQCILGMSFWLIFSLKDYSRDGDINWTLMKAGLDSIWPGQTDLRVGLECKDSRAEVWRWFTYQYSHIGLAHVTMNVVLNLLLGLPLEGFHGTYRTVIMYYVGVFGGACCYFVSDVHHPAVGMSGGCYSLIGMHLGCLLLNWHQKRYRWIKLFFLALLAGADTLNARFAVSNGDVHVSHSIHFGGYVAGVIICLILGRNLVVKHWERVLMIPLALLVGIASVSFCLGWGMSWPPQTIFEGVRWCWTRQVYNPVIFGDREWHCVRCASQACIEKWSRQKWIAEVSTWACDRRGGWTVTEP